MVNWPAIIKHSDDAELIYIRDQTEWDADADLHLFEYEESDYLIDSGGEIFSLTRRKDRYLEPESSGEVMALRDILCLVKAHAAQKGSCCVAKLYAPTIKDAFKIVESLNDT